VVRRAIDPATKRERAEDGRRTTASVAYVAMPPTTTETTSAVAVAAETWRVCSRLAMRNPRNGASSTALSAQIPASRSTRTSPATARTTDHGVEPSGRGGGKGWAASHAA
jgi:hypothetical protein